MRSCTVSVGVHTLYYRAAHASAVHSWNNRIRPTQFNRRASILLPIISVQAGKRGEVNWRTEICRICRVSQNRSFQHLFGLWLARGRLSSPFTSSNIAAPALRRRPIGRPARRRRVDSRRPGALRRPHRRRPPPHLAARARSYSQKPPRVQLPAGDQPADAPPPARTTAPRARRPEPAAPTRHTVHPTGRDSWCRDPPVSTPAMAEQAMHCVLRADPCSSWLPSGARRR